MKVKFSLLGENRMKNKKRNLIIILTTVIALLLVLPFSLAALIYEDSFGERYETYTPMSRSIDEFKELNMQRFTFVSNNGQELVGYQYFKNIEDAVGVVVIAHGLGGGGHNSYMDIADYFASNGYTVFAYDATGNDESEGDSVNGIPQGLIDLDYAIRFVKETSDFANLPIMLFGHSWGAYSAGSVLNYHPDVKAVVMVAGFNESMDIIEEEVRRIAGDRINILLPYVSLYERIRFREYAKHSSVQGFENSTAGVLIIHSADDEMISSEKSFDFFFNRYKNNPRFKFVQYKDRGHDGVWYADSARVYREKLNEAFNMYLSSLEAEFTSEIKADYLNKNLDKSLLFKLDEELMSNIVRFYDSFTK